MLALEQSIEVRNDRMKMTRKKFLRAASGSVVLLLLQACGGGDDGMAPLTKCESSGATISGNHGHALTINVQNLDFTKDKTYSIVGAASHDHLVSFAPAQLQILKAGKTVVVTSTTTFQPPHDVIAACV